jgi:hypothetical protein
MKNSKLCSIIVAVFVARDEDPRGQWRTTCGVAQPCEDVARLFYMHFWAVDDALKLAKTLRDALDQTNSTSGR